MVRVITAPGVLTNVQGQIDHVTDIYNDVKDNNLKPLTITLDPVTNANGAVSVVTEDPRVTEDMKPISLEVGTPEVFKAPISVTTASGTVTLACDNAAGTSTVKVTFIKTSPVEGGEDYPPAVTSTEFDILADRIGSLATLDTSTKASAVSAINEVVGSIGTVPSGKTVESQISEVNSKLITKNISNPINLASGATSVSSNAYKTGNVVQLVLQATFASLSNGTNILSSIVDSIKPKLRTIVSVFDYNTGKHLNGTLWISDASIYYYGDSLTNKTIIIVATYLTE